MHVNPQINVHVKQDILENGVKMQFVLEKHLHHQVFVHLDKELVNHQIIANVNLDIQGMNVKILFAIVFFLQMPMFVMDMVNVFHQRLVNVLVAMEVNGVNCQLVMEFYRTTHQFVQEGVTVLMSISVHASLQVPM